MAASRKQQAHGGADASAVCACASRVNGEVHEGRKGVGPGGKAAGVDPQLRRANLRQLRRIEGQVRGIAAMIEEDRYCADVITQIAAVRESLHSVARNLMRNHVRHCAAAAMTRGEQPREEMIEELLGLVARIAR